MFRAILALSTVFTVAGILVGAQKSTLLPGWQKLAMPVLSRSSPPEAVDTAKTRTGFQSLNVDDFGAKGDGVTDDSPAFSRAHKSLRRTGGAIHLSCNKRYYVGTAAEFDALNGVVVRGCLPHADYWPAIVGDSRFAGDLNTMGSIIRDPNATLVIGQSGGLEDLLVLQKGVVIPQADASNFAGTAISLPRGRPGAGSSAFLRNVAVIGGNICVDFSSGGDRIKVEGLLADCINGETIGQSADSAKYDDIHNWPVATVGYEGQKITSIKGDGKVTTLRYEGAPDAFSAGEHIDLNRTFNASHQRIYGSARLTVLSVNGNTIEAQSKIDTAAAQYKPTNMGTILNAERTAQRDGVGLYTLEGCDDTRFGTIFDFGHRIGFDFSCHGIMDIGRLWADNNGSIGVRIRNQARTHFNSIDIEGQNIGMDVINSQVQGANLSIVNTRDSALRLHSSRTIFQVGQATLNKGGQNGAPTSVLLDMGDGAPYASFGSLDVRNFPAAGAIIPPFPANNLSIGKLTTDQGYGNIKLYVGRERQHTPVRCAGSTILLPNSNIGASADIYVLPPVTTDRSCAGPFDKIEGFWGGRQFDLEMLGTQRILNSASLKTDGGAPLGGRANTIVHVFANADANPGVWEARAVFTPK